MAFRRKAHMGKSHRQFKHRSKKTHRLNKAGPLRGGIRL